MQSREPDDQPLQWQTYFHSPSSIGENPNSNYYSDANIAYHITNNPPIEHN